jgi:hypothetical protein
MCGKSFRSAAPFAGLIFHRGVEYIELNWLCQKVSIDLSFFGSILELCGVHDLRKK